MEDDGDVSSAPISSRRGHAHAASHAHTGSDASITVSNAGGEANAAGASSTGNSRAYYDGLAARSSRLQNMPSSSSMSIDSIKSYSGDSTLQTGIPESPAPHIPHAPAHPRHISPSSISGHTATSPSRPPIKIQQASMNSVSSVNSEAVHHPAPRGFLAKMSALDLQESFQQAIDGAGADGVTRNYRINPAPTDRPVRIYADGVYDLVGGVGALLVYKWLIVSRLVPLWACTCAAASEASLPVCALDSRRVFG